MIKAFEDEEEKNSMSTKRTSAKRERSNSSPTKKCLDSSQLTKRSSSRPLATRQLRQRASANNSLITDDEDDEPMERKKSRQSRKSVHITRGTASINNNDTDTSDTAKLDHIRDVRRNTRTKIIEYEILPKNSKKSFWIRSDKLVQAQSQAIINFLEEKYV
jgi:hypothetical protein